MAVKSGHIMLVSVSGRALAQSAQRGAWRSVVVDAFADLDTLGYADRCIRVETNNESFVAQDLLARTARVDRDGIGLVYGSGVDSGLVQQLARGRKLMGNKPEILSLINNPATFFSVLDELKIPHPAVSFEWPGEVSGWLVKQAGGSGGGHIRRLRANTTYPDQYYFQKFVPGTSMSALFLADGNNMRVIGFNTQLTENRHPQSPFTYAGAVNRAQLNRLQRYRVEKHILRLVSYFGLCGLNSLDFVLYQDEPQVLEVNPRPSASFELYDADVPGGMLRWHVRACERVLPEPSLINFKVRAHAIVYLHKSVIIPSGFDWRKWCADRPRAGARIEPGQPVCSVIAEGRDLSSVKSKVQSRCVHITRLLTSL